MVYSAPLKWTWRCGVRSITVVKKDDSKRHSMSTHGRLSPPSHHRVTYLWSGALEVQDLFVSHSQIREYVEVASLVVEILVFEGTVNNVPTDNASG